MVQSAGRRLRRITPLVAPLFLLQCGGSAKPVDLQVVAQSSSSAYVRDCQPSDYPGAISTLKGDREVRESIEELNLEVFCTFAAWQAQVDAKNAALESGKIDAQRQMNRERAKCSELSSEPGDNGWLSDKEDCELSAENTKYETERSLRFQPLELGEFKDFCNSLVGLIALMEIYPDSVNPRALAELVSLEDTAKCSTR